MSCPEEDNMRSILFHCKEYKTKITRLANRPEAITPEKMKHKDKNCIDCIDCIVVLVTIEKGDEPSDIIPKLIEEINIMSREIKRDKVVILPFAHLSNNLSSAKDGIDFVSKLETSLSKGFMVIRDHFGSHKELLLDLYGHPGNARYREFY